MAGSATRTCKFRLEAVDGDVEITQQGIEVEHTRMIPTDVKRGVWQRDQGRCVMCGSTQDLHFDHVIPYSRGGASSTVENIQLLCARHNLEKRDRIQ
jgi:5-methylcytosine-specific restriction endonuclease McrA